MSATLPFFFTPPLYLFFSSPLSLHSLHTIGDNVGATAGGVDSGRRRRRRRWRRLATTTSATVASTMTQGCGGRVAPESMPPAKSVIAAAVARRRRALAAPLSLRRCRRARSPVAAAWDATTPSEPSSRRSSLSPPSPPLGTPPPARNRAPATPLSLSLHCHRRSGRRLASAPPSPASPRRRCPCPPFAEPVDHRSTLPLVDPEPLFLGCGSTIGSEV
jgi:hypothetical protein